MMFHRAEIPSLQDDEEGRVKSLCATVQTMSKRIEIHSLEGDEEGGLISLFDTD